jgi:hypothetical protein
MPPPLLGRIDCALGDSLERARCAHHRRRLRRAGWEHALSASDGGWRRGGGAARAGNAIEVLIDGATALPAMAEAIAGARSHATAPGTPAPTQRSA